MPKTRGDFGRSRLQLALPRHSETVRPSQKTANGGLSRDIEGKISGDWTGWLVTQSRQLPAPPIFAANRENNRELCEKPDLSAPETPNSSADTAS